MPFRRLRIEGDRLGGLLGRSVVALLLSVVALWQGIAWVLPGIWLLLLGHSLSTLGGLASSAMRTVSRSGVPRAGMDSPTTAALFNRVLISLKVMT